MNFWDYLDKRAERIEKRSMDMTIAVTQRNNTYFYGTMFFLSLVPLFLLPDPTDVVKTIMIATSSTLGTIAVMQNQFWYGRPRGGGIPDPSNTSRRTVIEEVSSPDGKAVTLSAQKAGRVADPDISALGVVDVITNDQATVITNAIKEANIGLDKLLDAYKVDAISKIPAEKFAEVQEWIKTFKV